MVVEIEKLEDELAGVRKERNGYLKELEIVGNNNAGAKLVSIKNVDRLSNVSAKGDVSFTPVTLIYGENGRGKTTLCSISRSLQSADKTFIEGRITLGGRW